LRPHLSEPDPLLDNTNDPSPDDADAVQNLIIALRASLTTSQNLLSSQAARLAHLSDIEAELAKVKDERAFVAAAKEAVEVQLKEEIKKREVAEETVEALRGQVESARRGVMTLQKQEKERKRMSTMGISGLGVGGLGLGGAGEEEEVLKDLAGKDKDKKRQSTLKSHRRISSQSEPDGMYASSAIMVSPNQIATPVLGGQIAQPSRGGLREFKLGSGIAANNMTSPNQISTSPLPTIAQEDTPISPIIDPSFVSSSMSNSNSNAISPEEAARLRVEVMTLQAQLDHAEEAREASEQCLKALREFIATSPGGGGTDSFDGQMNLTSADLVGIRLPPLPTDKDPDEPPIPPAKEEKRPAMTGWGSSLGKLWKGQGGAAPPSVMSPHSTVVEPSTPGLLSPGQSVRSLPQRSNSPTSAMSQLPSAQEPIEDKLNAIPTSNMPLANFVASWTKTVAPGTPAATPLSGSTSGSGEARPSAARAFSGLWGRKKDDKEKEFPIAPEVQEMQEENAIGLEPSPLIADSEPMFDFSARQEGDDEEEAEVMTTPKQSERGSKEMKNVVPEDQPEAEDSENKEEKVVSAEEKREA